MEVEVVDMGMVGSLEGGWKCQYFVFVPGWCERIHDRGWKGREMHVEALCMWFRGSVMVVFNITAITLFKDQLVA